MFLFKITVAKFGSKLVKNVLKMIASLYAGLHSNGFALSYSYFSFNLSKILLKAKKKSLTFVFRAEMNVDKADDRSL